MKRKYISNYFSSGHLLRFVLYTTLVAFILGSCTERIDIKTDDEFRKLAVEGYISADIQVIRLTETSGYFSQEPPKPVPDAVVVVTEADETYQFSEDTENPGNYIPPENFPVDLESSYHLTIDLEEKIGGESHFESDANMPMPSDQIDSIQVTYRSDFETWIVQLYAYEPPGLNYYMFTASVNDVPVTDSLSRVGVSDDRIVDGTYLYGIWVLFLNEDEVQVGDTVTLATSSISEDYYRYLTEAQTELFPKNPLFSGPPANVRSNISNGAVGYFAVFSSYFSSTIINEKDE